MHHDLGIGTRKEQCHQLYHKKQRNGCNGDKHYHSQQCAAEKGRKRRLESGGQRYGKSHKKRMLAYGYCGKIPLLVIIEDITEAMCYTLLPGIALGTRRYRRNEYQLHSGKQGGQKQRNEYDCYPVHNDYCKEGDARVSASAVAAVSATAAESRSTVKIPLVRKIEYFVSCSLDTKPTPSITSSSVVMRMAESE